MKIQTGRGTIPLITLIAIWSISALTSLPGLAVSPILGDLTKIFPKATDLDIQMLTSLPSLLIIPFILLGGKLTEKVDYVRVLKVGLWLFAASGILYLISNRMWQLIVVSAFARYRFRSDYPFIYRVGFQILCRNLSGETVRIKLPLLLISH